MDWIKIEDSTLTDRLEEGSFEDRVLLVYDELNSELGAFPARIISNESGSVAMPWRFEVWDPFDLLPGDYDPTHYMEMPICYAPQ